MDRQQRISISNVNQQNVPVKQAQSIDVTIGGGVTTPATADKLGLVKVGNGLAITADGALSVNVTASDVGAFPWRHYKMPLTRRWRRQRKAECLMVLRDRRVKQDRPDRREILEPMAHRESKGLPDRKEKPGLPVQPAP